jgi:rhodanese-related sulfurtransferase
MSSKSSTHKQTKKQNKLLLPLILIAAVVVVILVLVLTNTAGGHTLPSTVTVTDAYERFNNGAFLLDVREPSEWQAGHVDGAVLIPLGELQSRMNELPQDQDILIICRSGNRSGQARDLLRAAGMKRTTSVSGGMNAWSAAGLPIVTGN